jgi:hypothetical protein
LHYIGLKGIQKDTSTITTLQKVESIAGHALWVGLGWLPLLFHNVASGLVAVKNL